jgi:putative flavoprotein involved in K+ transport
MDDTILDVVVVGAGQAGLGISYLLKKSGMRHVVLERGRIGESWRAQRWDSFALNTPNRFNILPGDTYRGSNPDGFDSARNFVSYLEGYANRFQLPVQEHVRVVSVDHDSSRFHVTASIRGTTVRYVCRQLVVASGATNEPKIPFHAAHISPNIMQYHAGEYRTPSELPDGSVLVVGGGQSGLQLAEDIIEGGKKVYISTSAVGRVPRRYRGEDIVEWLLRIGFFDMKTEDISDPKILELKQPQVSGVGPLGHTLSLQSLAKRGAVVIGKIDSASGYTVTLHPNAADHIQFADQVSRNIKTLIDQFIVENHLNCPPPEPDPADAPETNTAVASALRLLDLEAENIRSIIWATGFTADFSYLKGNGIDGNGRPLHRNGISNTAGLYFLGLPWLRKRKSGIINGIVEDATFIADAVKNTSTREW